MVPPVVLPAVSVTEPCGWMEPLCALRAIATYVKDHIGQPFLATNKPGGGSTAAAIEMLSKPADGYTVVALLSSGYAPEVYKFFYDVPYTSKDLVPVIRVGSFPFGFYVNASSPWKTLADFTRDAKASPGKLSYGHTGRGVQLHLIPAAYANAAGIELREVPTKGASEIEVAFEFDRAAVAAAVIRLFHWESPD